MNTWWKKLLIAWLAIFALSSTANAGFLFEPYVGYNTNLKGEWETTPEETFSWNSYEVGGRLGWIFKWIGIGVEFDWKQPKVKWDSTEAEQEWNMTNIGAFVGLYLGHRGQWMIRGKYFFMSNAKSDFDNFGTPMPVTLEYKGTGWGVDIGYRFLNWLALNLEWTQTVYDELNGSTNIPNWNTGDLLVSISLPFEFPSRSSRR